jgi:hypothetical protein
MGDIDVPEFSAKRFEFQNALLEKGFEQIQKHILQLDEILFKIKASAVTVWVALMGWSITAKEAALVSLGAFVIIGFWLLEAQFKGVQIQYKKISRKLMDFVNDNADFDEQFSQSAFRAGIIHPVALHRTELEKVSSMMIGFLSPTVSTVYLFLGTVNALIWLAVR